MPEESGNQHRRLDSRRLLRRPGLQRNLIRYGLLAFVALVLITVRPVLLPFFLAVFLAFLIMPLVRRLTGLRVGRLVLPRWAAVVVIYVFLVLLLLGGGWGVVPALWSEVNSLGLKIPGYVNQTQQWLGDLEEHGNHLLASATGTIQLPDEDLEIDLRVTEPEAIRYHADHPQEFLDAARQPLPFEEVRFQVFNAARRAKIRQSIEEHALGSALLTPERVWHHFTGTYEARGYDRLVELDPAEAVAHPPATRAPAWPDTLTFRWGDQEVTYRASEPALDGAAPIATGGAGGASTAAPPPRSQILNWDTEVAPRVADDLREEIISAAIASVPQVQTAPLKAQAGKLLTEGAAGLLAMLQGLVGLASRLLLTGIIVLMLTAFFIADWERIKTFTFELLPVSSRQDYDDILAGIDRGLSGAIRGQVMVCVINGCLTTLGLWLIGVKFALTLGLVAGLFSLVPIFGTILSTIPICLVALASPEAPLLKGFLVLGWIILIHLVEANYLNPTIIGSQAHIHPVLIIFALVVGEHFYHLVGALLAVPVLSIVKAIFMHLLHKAQALDDAELARPPPTPDA